MTERFKKWKKNQENWDHCAPVGNLILLAAVAMAGTLMRGKAGQKIFPAHAFITQHCFMVCK